MLYFDEYGSKDAPAILLLHGAGALDTFCRQYCFFEKYRLIVPHLCGAGQAAGREYRPGSLMREIFALLDRLNIDRVGVIGHSLGAQLAVMLVCDRPERFSFAVFLSAWVNPRHESIKKYFSLAEISVKILHLKWLIYLQGTYWHYTKKQTEYMAEYSKMITPNVYKSFFINTLKLTKLPGYMSVDIPMFAICGTEKLRI